VNNRPSKFSKGDFCQIENFCSRRYICTRKLRPVYFFSATRPSPRIQLPSRFVFVQSSHRRTSLGNSPRHCFASALNPEILQRSSMRNNPLLLFAIINIFNCITERSTRYIVMFIIAVFVSDCCFISLLYVLY
jgi:hypothetical protein